MDVCTCTCMYNWWSDTKQNHSFQSNSLKLAFKSIRLSSVDVVFVLINRTLSLTLSHGGKNETSEITIQLIQTFSVSQNTGIPSFPAAAAAAVTHRKGGIRRFSINLSRTDLLQFRLRDARTFLLQHKAQPELLTGGEHKKPRARWGSGAALGLPAALVEQRDPASVGWRQSPRSHRCPGMLRQVWAIRICIVLMFSRQTVTQLWHRLPLTSSSSFHCGGQIVANLTLTDVCLPFLWAAREDVFQSPQPCQRWHHATFSPQMSSTAAGCWRGWHEKEKKSRKTPPLANMATPCTCMPARVPFPVCHWLGIWWWSTSFLCSHVKQGRGDLHE